MSSTNPLQQVESREVIVGGHYIVKNRIGAGSFGEICIVIDKRTGFRYAAKIERADSKHPQLQYEYRVYRALSHLEGIPRVRWCGTATNGESEFNVVIMDLLGESLESVFNRCGRKFSLKTTIMLALQLLDRIEMFHENNFLHRDIKPDNFLLGLNESANQVYMIDMGLTKRYRDPDTQMHIPWKEHKKLTGTPRYASLNTHHGIEQSRRDDLESLGYMLLYFRAGKLPWQGLKAMTKEEKYEKIADKKRSTDLQTLCKSHPECFLSYMQYCRGLGFDEEPDYEYLRNLFRYQFRSAKFDDDGVFDWTARFSLSSCVLTPPPRVLPFSISGTMNPTAPTRLPNSEATVEALKRQDPAVQHEALRQLLNQNDRLQSEIKEYKRIQVEQNQYINLLRTHIDSFASLKCSAHRPSTTLNLPNRSGQYVLDEAGNATHQPTDSARLVRQLALRIMSEHPGMFPDHELQDQPAKKQKIAAPVRAKTSTGRRRGPSILCPPDPLPTELGTRFWIEFPDGIRSRRQLTRNTQYIWARQRLAQEANGGVWVPPPEMHPHFGRKSKQAMQQLQQQQQQQQQQQMQQQQQQQPEQSRAMLYRPEAHEVDDAGVADEDDFEDEEDDFDDEEEVDEEDEQDEEDEEEDEEEYYYLNGGGYPVAARVPDQEDPEDDPDDQDDDGGDDNQLADEHDDEHDVDEADEFQEEEDDVDEHGNYGRTQSQQLTGESAVPAAQPLVASGSATERLMRDSSGVGAKRKSMSVE